MLQKDKEVIQMNDKETMMYNRYVLGKINLKQLLEWHEKELKKEREVKNVA